MRFKVGDKVKVKENLQTGYKYHDGYFYFAEGMQKYKGQIVTIKKILQENEGLRIEPSYRIEEDEGKWRWASEMLEPTEEKYKDKMNIEELNKEYKAKMDALLEEYKEKAKELTEEKEEPFIKEGQRYIYIASNFIIFQKKFCNDDFDRDLLPGGNMYPYTEETKDKVCKEVELIAKKRKLQSEIEMFARLNNEKKIDWNNENQPKWSFYICYKDNNIELDCSDVYREMNTTYFSSREIAEKARDKFGSRIKELYFKKNEK